MIFFPARISDDDDDGLYAYWIMITRGVPNGVRFNNNNKHRYNMHYGKSPLKKKTTTVFVELFSSTSRRKQRSAAVIILLTTPRLANPPAPFWRSTANRCIEVVFTVYAFRQLLLCAPRVRLGGRDFFHTMKRVRCRFRPKYRTNYIIQWCPTRGKSILCGLLEK